MSEEQEIFFEWKNRTNELLVEEDIIIPSEEDNTKITSLEYLINTVIEKLEDK